MAGYIGSSVPVATSGVERKKTYTITTTTTSLTGASYTPDKVHVFHNGVRLVDGTDYTATDGTTVTLNSAAENGDEVVVISYATLSPSDSVYDPDGVITVSGSKVGIGTSSPDSILDVRSGSNPQVVLNNTDGTSNDSHDFRIGTYGGSTPYWSSLSLDASSHTFKTYGAERMRIDSSGRVTMPYQPVISGQMGTAMISPSGPTLLAFDDFWVSEGISYNSTTKRFTVPVSGNYRITLNPFFSTSSGNARVLVGVNNDAPNTSNHYGHSYREVASYNTGCINSVAALSANDYIVFYLQGGALYNQSSDRFNQFSIQLIS